tara:strand:+ start:1155 stop:1322 length:168 start_codon:yes stop_codon:yes gene_type:complete
MAVVGTLCMVVAVGAIDGGYKGVPMNDNWLLCGTMTLLGISSFILSLYAQEASNN